MQTDRYTTMAYTVLAWCRMANTVKVRETPINIFPPVTSNSDV